MIQHSSVLSRFGGTSPLALVAALAIAAPALSQTPPASSATSQQSGTTADPAPSTPAAEEIVVTGFRASLSSALNLKKNETAAIDSIVSEDIGKFPDSNLAESMQRIPGISLARGDGGEGRNISVRGLGAQFTRIRINGMEGTAQTGGSDIQGAGNSGRSFDFNVFPSEIFSSLAVRKTTSADVEEGSLGATVDLRAPHPLDQRGDFVATFTGRGVYSEIAKKVNPRLSGLVSKKFADGTFGVLLSGAYQKRDIREVGYSAVDVLSSTLGGNQFGSGATAQPFCTPIGFATQSPPTGYRQTATNAATAVGSDALNCSTGNPRTGTIAAYNTILALRSNQTPAAAATPGSGAFFPRIPRYVNSEQDQERYGGSLSLQWKPDDNTDISLDGLYSRFKVERRDNYIAAISFARSITNQGQPMVSVRDAQFDANGSLQYGLFDGVDVRSEGLVDRFTSTFKQLNLNFDHKFSDSFQVTGLVGRSYSNFVRPLRLQTFVDAVDTRNFSIDARDGKNIPILGFGIDVANPANFNYAPTTANGTFLGGFSTQGAPSFNKTRNTTAELNTIWNITPNFAFKAGAQWRESNFRTRSAALYAGDNLTQTLPAGVTLAGLTRQITGVGSLLGRGAPDSWTSIDAEKWIPQFYDKLRFCTTASCGNGTSQVRERVTSGYLMTTFNTEDMLPIPVRGDAGVRYVSTTQLSVGFLVSAQPNNGTTNVTAVPNAITRKYEDWLPSGNLVFELTPQLLFRASAARVLARPELGQLIVGTPTITATTRSASLNNAFLEPIRADTYDLALEWYFRPGSLFSVAYYHKDIQSFIQTGTTLVPFNQLGLPDALLSGTNTAPTEIFTVRQPLNTPGGPLKGFEINAQVQFNFLPGLLKNFGALGNYNHVTSKINYLLGSGATYVADLVGLSRDAASGTLYYDDGRFSIRGTASYRGPYIRGIIGTGGNDVNGNKSNIFVDGSANYNLTDNIKLIAEVQNITDERNTLTVDGTRQDTLFETRIGRTFNLGATVKF